jgi:predicted membrane-bound spermidine synthase
MSKLAQKLDFNDNLKIVVSTLFISISMFVYQVVLTRIFSALFMSNYVFLITSFAILGLGVGSIIAYKKSNKKLQSKDSNGINTCIVSLQKTTFLLSISYIFVLGIIYVLPYLNALLIYIFLATIPFVLGGYYFSILFRQFSSVSSKLYFADLVGSGLGSLIVIQLLNYIGIFKTVFVISLLALVPVILLSKLTNKKNITSKIIFSVYVITLLLPNSYANNIEQNFNSFLTNTNKTFGNLKNQGISASIIYTKWNSFSRTDVIKIDNSPDQLLVTIDGAANAPMYKFDGNIKSLEKYKSDIKYIPYTFGKNDNTLIIGAGGGRDLLYALAAGSKKISAVEINTASIDAVNKFKDFNGNIFNRPEVKVFAQDGRNFIRKSKDKYDNIFLSLVMTNASQGMGYALSENYIYTTEAVQDYLNHLTPNGKLTFEAHSEDDLGKIVATAMSALNNRGIQIKDTPKYMSIFARNDGMSDQMISYPVAVIKNTPFSIEESKQLIDNASKNNIAPIFVPLVYEKGILSNIEQAHISFDDYLKKSKTNVTPATDDNPFYYNFQKGISPMLLITLIFLIVICIAFFVFLKSTNQIIKPAIYFALLGAGYMMIEIPLIQKFILYLGHPVRAFTYVLGALLIGSGLGSYFSNKKPFDKVFKRIYVAPFLVVVIEIILILIMPALFKNTATWSLDKRILLSSLLVMMQGFFMGMPFPRGLTMLAKNNRSTIIPLMWGINGLMAVVGSVLSVIISMQFGFTTTLISGTVFYTMVMFFNKI